MINFRIKKKKELFIEFENNILIQKSKFLNFIVHKVYYFITFSNYK